jgi:hypothetical protein
MPLHAPDDADFEKFLIYGGTDAGKTHLWMSVAHMAVKTKADTRFWVIDNDNTTRRMMGPRGQFAHIRDAVELFRPSSGTAFEETVEFTERAKAEADPDDWLIVDMQSNVWDSMSPWWMERVYGSSGASYWSQIRAELVEKKKADENAKDKRFGEFEGIDWQYISKSYLSWEKMFTQTTFCHVIALAAETEFTDFNDRDGTLRGVYANTGGIGARGQKQQAHRFHTVLRAERVLDRSGRRVSVKERSLSVIKDRGREAIWEERGGSGLSIPVSNSPMAFVKDYLMPFADWTLR